MRRENFVKVVEEALDSLPQEFRSRIRNVCRSGRGYVAEPAITAVGAAKGLLLGLFNGVPTTKKSIFDLPTGPD